jgi:simple sugar transport system permease protein
MSIKKLAFQAETYVFILIIIFMVVVQSVSGVFFTGNNIVGILRSMIVPLTYALCAYLALVSTGPDVSFPMIAALSTFLSIEIITNIGFEGSILVVYLIAMGFGLLMGMFNGIIIAKFNFPSLIVTLATSAIFTGILFGTFGAMRRDLPPIMLEFGRTSLIHNPLLDLSNIQVRLPYAMIFAVILYIIAFFVLNKTMIGRGVFAVGGDEIAAERAGFSVPAIRFGVFAVNGVIAAIAGVSYTVMTPMFFPVEFSG